MHMSSKVTLDRGWCYFSTFFVNGEVIAFNLWDGDSLSHVFGFEISHFFRAVEPRNWSRKHASYTLWNAPWSEHCPWELLPAWTWFDKPDFACLFDCPGNGKLATVGVTKYACNLFICIVLPLNFTTRILKPSKHRIGFKCWSALNNVKVPCCRCWVHTFRLCYCH